MGELRRRYKSSGAGERVSAESIETTPYKIMAWSLSPLILLCFLFAYIAFLLLMGVYFNDRLPDANSENGISPNFSSTNALQYLKGLVDIGPKVTGSYENELEAVNYLTRNIYDILKKTSAIHNITYDLQKASGEFSLSFISKQVTLVYRNVQNVIVRIGPKNMSDKSLLLNCHFDSVPLSPGASDDGLNCAVMLEILRVIATSNEVLPHNIIFLFNGAEENPLLASHGFITQHKWASEVKAFINLESCGAGGREFLFQAGPNHPWLVQSYEKAAKYPSGVVVAEEIFQSGLVPSDTDFRIFRDFGGKPGLDFAHCKNGYAYHTEYDSIESIDNVLGVIQHTGENILSLVKTILNRKEFDDPQKYNFGRQIYYDLFGIWFVSYSADFGKALNSLAVILAIAGYYMTAYFTHSWTILRSFCPLASTIMYGTIVMSLMYNLCLAYFLAYFDLTMSWYSSNFLIVPLYVIPTIVVMLTNIIYYEKYDKSAGKYFFISWYRINLKLKSHCLSVLLFWTTLLFLSTFFSLRSSYLLMILVFLPASYTLIMSLVKPASTKMVWTVLFIVSTLPSALYLTYLAVTAFRLFIPITGRMGTEKNPEIIIGVLATIFSSAIFSYISTFILAVKKHWFVVKSLIIVHFLSLIFIAVSSSGFPFSTETPQRVYATHVNRQFFDLHNLLKRSDSLFWIQNMDRRGRNVLNFLSNAPLLDKFCEEDGLCGLPWYGKIQERSASTCISSAPHNISDDIVLELHEKQFISKNVIQFSFNISGPDHMGLIITPINNSSLKSWSLPGNTVNQTSFLIGYVHGFYASQWNLHFDLVIAEHSRHRSLVQIEIYGLYFHHRMHFTKPFNELLSMFPDWSHVSPCLSTYKYFVF